MMTYILFCLLCMTAMIYAVKAENKQVVSIGWFILVMLVSIVPVANLMGLVMSMIILVNTPKTQAFMARKLF